jgi:alpha-L-rhamnosidase
MTLVLVAAIALQGTPTLLPVALQCEHLADPVGIAVAAPMLSWKLAPARTGLQNLRQSGSRILVASRPELLAEGRADLWDHEIRTSQTLDIPYAGKPLDSGRPYWWKVRVWDQDGRASEWSKPARWTTGILDPAEWKAQWIGWDVPYIQAVEATPNFRGAKWIWHAEDEPRKTPPATRYFKALFVVPEDMVGATLLASADDQFEVDIDGRKVAASDGKTDAWRRPVEADVTSFVKPGENLIAVRVQNSAEGAAGLIFKLIIRVRDGRKFTYASGDTWVSSATPDAVPKTVRVLGEHGMEPWGAIMGANLILPPPRYLRKGFEVRKPVAHAVAYASALGLVELHLNGRKVGDEFFVPGWTDYEKRVYYRAYDVTRSLKRGGNAIGAILGDGWYAGYVGYGGRREHYGEATRAFVQLDITYADGTKETVATGPDWLAQTGPIRESDFLMGELYDGRREMAGWDSAEYDDSVWQKVDVTSNVEAKLEAFPGNPVRVFAELTPVSVARPTEEDRYVLDLGQNIAGFARIRVRGEQGRAITLRFAERLNPDGTIYTANLRGARATDTYICKGQGIEVWQPRFTFHGFQYIEVSGLGYAPKPEDILGIAVSSDTGRAGNLETSDPMLNRLVSNAWWTQKMNFIDVPTDCPQRDERLGWTGDAQAYIHTATMLDDVHAFFKKWLVSLEDAQREDGQFPMVAPLKVAGSDGGPGWADAGVICPWTIYEAYGDKQLLARHYPAMKRFIAFCVKRSTQDFLPPAQFHCFGDWVSIGSSTPNDVIYQAYWAHSADLTARAAEALGLPDEAEKFKGVFRRVKESFNRAFVSPEGVVKGDTQCAYVLAIAFDLVDGPMLEQAGRRLVADIEKRGWKLTTGFLGTRDILNALTKIGRNDVAFRLLHNDEFPSWGFTIKNGATSIWERWDGWTPEKGFQDPGMNSFAHYAFGAVVGWMMDQIPGIRRQSAGYEKILIAPQIDPNLTWAKGSYDSVRGRIVSNWKIEGGKLKLNVEIPPNTTALVLIPTQSGTPERVEVGSGSHAFEVPWLKN